MGPWIPLEGVVVGRVGDEQIWIRSDQGHTFSCIPRGNGSAELGIGNRVSLELDSLGAVQGPRRIAGGLGVPLGWAKKNRADGA